MTKQPEALIAEAKLSASIMELIASFEPQDIDGDDVDLRFEVDGFDTGCNVSLVEQCGKVSEQLTALIAALEQKEEQRANWFQMAQKLGEDMDSAEKRIAELENDEVRQRLANAEHQLHMAELSKHNLRASRRAQFHKRRAAENRIAELEAGKLAVNLPVVPVATVDIKRGNPNGIFSIHWHHAALSHADGTYHLFAIPVGD